MTKILTNSNTPPTIVVVGEETKIRLTDTLVVLNKVHLEIRPLIEKIDQISTNVFGDTHKSEDFMYMLYCPQDAKEEVIGEALYYPNRNVYMCIAAIVNEPPSVQTKGIALQIPEKWVEPGDAKKEIIIKKYISRLLHDQLCKCASIFDSKSIPIPDDINDTMAQIHEYMLSTGNMGDEYTKAIINGIISIYKNIYEKELGEGLTLFDIASSIDNIYPKTADKIICKLYKIGVGDTPYEVEQVGDMIHIKGLRGENIYSNTIYDITLEVPSGLYMYSDDEIEEYLIEYNLRKLNQIIVGSQIRISNSIAKYESYQGQFDAIRSAFDAIDLSKKVNEYGSI